LIDRQKAMVEYMDDIVGLLVATLDDLGLRENTIILFTTDNGSTTGISARRNGIWIEGGKGTLGEPGMNEPFIVNGPGLVPVGKKTNVLTDFTDLFPTFLDLAGVPLPNDVVLDGTSIADVILGKSQQGPRSWVLSMGFGPARLTNEGVRPAQTFTDRIIRNDRYKLWVLDGEPAALYDLIEDPYEEFNLIESPDPDPRAAMAELRTLIESFPEEDAYPRYDPTPPQPWDRKPD
jgi:arylsulfatase A-like enzyme